MTDEDYITHALAHSDMRRDELLADMVQFENSAAFLTKKEYVELGLYKREIFTDNQREMFISDRLHWPIVMQTCDIGWNAATEDKWLMQLLLRRAGVETPQILATFDVGNRLYPGTMHIKCEASLKNFLAANAGRPFFGKQLAGMASHGIFLSTMSDQNEVVLENEGAVPISTFFERLRSRKYIFQPVLKNHHFFSGIAKNLCTMRFALFVYDDMLRSAFAFVKVPQGDNLADHFQPVGNLALGLDLDTGTILSVRQRLPIGTRLLDASSELAMSVLGKRLPFWSEAMTAIARVAQVFAPVRYQSMDIAFTEHGPVIVEVNAGGGFGGPQLAYSKGLLQPHVSHFLEQAGVNLPNLASRLRQSAGI